MPSKKKLANGNSPFTADSLAWGAAYAMEQAWHQLEDAVLLIQHERYASSLVVATFGLEQLGRAEIYRENANRAFAGKQVTLGSMARDLADHMPKLYRAQIPVTGSEGSWGEAPPVGSDEFRQLRERLEATRKRLEKEAPQKALDDRKQALHVDPIHRAPGWNRPSRVITPEDADYYVGAVLVRYDQLREALNRDSTEIGKTIWARVQQLQLPAPPWDLFTWEQETSGSEIQTFAGNLKNCMIPDP